MEATMLLLGATGAVGRQVVEQALAGDVYSKIIALTRRPIEAYKDHPKLEQHIIDFEKLEEYQSLMKARDVVNALGSTIKKAGSKERFFRIDHDYPLDIARIAKSNGAQRFILVSSVGANPGSKTSNYLRVKGQLEQGIEALGFDNYVIYDHPCYWANEKNIDPEKNIGVWFDKTFRFIIPKRYRGIQVATIAQRIIEIGQRQPTGKQIFESEEIPV